MANTYITIDQFRDVLKRLEKLEHKHKEIEIPISISKDVHELKEEYRNIQKDVAVTDTKIGGLEAKMDERFNTMNERFDTVDEKVNSLRTEMNEKINSLRTEIRVTFGILLTVMIAIGIKIFTSSL